MSTPLEPSQRFIFSTLDLSLDNCDPDTNLGSERRDAPLRIDLLRFGVFFPPMIESFGLLPYIFPQFPPDRYIK